MHRLNGLLQPRLQIVVGLISELQYTIDFGVRHVVILHSAQNILTLEP
jgi:hypothetical protein